MRYALVLLIAMASSAVYAGQRCDIQPRTASGFQRASALAVMLKAELGQQVPRLVILARAGSDLSSYGMKYSHAAIAWRANADERWTVSHLLHDCGKADSSLYDEGLLNFFLDDPFEYSVKIITPNRKFQDALIELLENGAGWAVHRPKYNLVSHPRSKKYQNSSLWLLELMVSAIAVSNSSPEAKIRKQFKGDKIHVSRLKRLASIASNDTHFSDHPLSSRLKNKYELVTVRSLERFMTQMGVVQKIVELEV